jgi:hypothetical protein
MISVDSLGRMGNQMFQMAFAHAAARRLGTRYVLGPGDLWTAFAAGTWASPRVRLARKLEFRLRYGSKGPRKVLVGNDAEPEAVIAGLRDGAAYGGFFQSERYFAGHEAEVRELFAVREGHRAAFDDVYGGLDRYVCVHVRRGDYIDWQGGRALPASYFRDALGAIDDLDRYEVIVISDDLEAAARELRDVRRVRFERNPPMIDFQLLMNAAVVVASPSSFSWWGAWLNEVPDARVLVPEHWYGFPEGHETPRGVIPDRWQTVPVADPAVGASRPAAG